VWERRQKPARAEQPKARGGWPDPDKSRGLFENPQDKPIPLADAGSDKHLADRARNYSVRQK
jgi:hypothetical protein